MKNRKALQQQIISNFSSEPWPGKIAVAVSGGCDSVALLLILKHYCQMKKKQICVFHVDHSLREESPFDNNWVEKLAEQLNLEFYARRADCGDLKSLSDRGVEAWARRFRYQSFAEMILESGATQIATGHTADDQAETVLMRLMRGTSIKGLAGIRPKRTLRLDQHEIKVWRPLLACRRTVLEDYLDLCEQPWRDDPTNKSSAFYRNRVRNELLPKMHEIWSGASGKLVDMAEKMADIHQFVGHLAKKYCKKHLSGNRLSINRVPAKPVRTEVIRIWLLSLGLADNTSQPLILRLDNMWTNSRSKIIDQRNFVFRRSTRHIEFVRNCKT